LRKADLLILPGSKQTLNDLDWLRRAGFEPGILHFAGSAGVVGICGGMQMMGRSIDDPRGAENNGVARAGRGLGLLPIATVIEAEKVTRVVSGDVRAAKIFGQRPSITRFNGYEIHLGDTLYPDGTERFADIQRCGESIRRPDGAVAPNGRAIGTYVHGLFSDDAFRHSFLDAARAACGLTPLADKLFITADRERSIDRLAEHVRRALDMDLVHDCLGIT
jgi:adenosylcobyric acid synthase